MEGAVLIIYTGGTIGMIEDFASQTLKPFNFSQIEEEVPELKKFQLKIDTYSFEQPIDSSNMNPKYWKEIAEVIEKNYELYDGFVVLHGSDTMSYTASALSFMLEGLNKPVIITGSQLPIGTLRTDGKENLISSVEIASAKENGIPIVPEVAIYFEFQLYRGNRTAKVSSEVFDAFKSFNYPDLAQAGIQIKYNKEYIQTYQKSKLTISTNFDTNVGILKLFPGINEAFVDAVLSTKDLKALVLETYGSGNASTEEWFLKKLEHAIKNNILILNVTQCIQGSVNQGKYNTSEAFNRIGVLSGYDITTESAITKLMYVLGKYSSKEDIHRVLQTSIVGEVTI